MKKYLILSALVISLFSVAAFAGITYTKDSKGKLEVSKTSTRKRNYTLAFIQEQIDYWTNLKTEAVAKGVTE